MGETHTQIVFFSFPLSFDFRQICCGLGDTSDEGALNQASVPRRMCEREKVCHYLFGSVTAVFVEWDSIWNHWYTNALLHLLICSLLTCFTVSGMFPYINLTGPLLCITALESPVLAILELFQFFFKDSTIFRCFSESLIRVAGGVQFEKKKKKTQGGDYDFAN